MKDIVCIGAGVLRSGEGKDQAINSGEERRKRWMLWGGALYYSGHGNGPAYYIIDTDKVEIHLDKNGEILDLIIKNAEKYLEPEEIEEIAVVYRSEDIERQIKELRRD